MMKANNLTVWKEGKSRERHGLRRVMNISLAQLQLVAALV